IRRHRTVSRRWGYIKEPARARRRGKGESMIRNKKIGLVSLTVLFASSSLAFGAANDVARMERAIDLWVSNGEFMGAVLVAKDGKILINKGYGSANLDWKVPNSPTTKFR